jgi:hypothetical protein
MRRPWFASAELQIVNGALRVGSGLGDKAVFMQTGVFL